MVFRILVHAKARRPEAGVLVDDTAEAVFQQRCAEVDEKPEGQVHQAQIRQELLGVHRVEDFDGLQLDDQLPFDQ